MFTIFNLKNSVDLTSTELDMIYEKLVEWQDKIPILQEVPWRAIQYKWYLDMDDDDVLGAFNQLDKVIYLSRQRLDIANTSSHYTKDMAVSDAISEICATICHELVHWKQCQDYGMLFYSLLAFPLWRNFTVERKAYAIGDMCYDLINEEAAKPYRYLNVQQDNEEI